MNPWQSLRAEAFGALRSLRYDLAAKRARRHMNADTMVLPTIKARNAKRRTAFAAGAVLLPVAGFGGYLAVSSGLDALFADAGTPNGLPHVALARPPAPSSASPAAASVVERLVPQHHRKPSPSRTEARPTISPPVPTPAPTATCTPTPLPTPSPTTPTITPSPRPSGTPSPAPTSSPTP